MLDDEGSRGRGLWLVVRGSGLNGSMVVPLSLVPAMPSWVWIGLWIGEWIGVSPLLSFGETCLSGASHVRAVAGP